MREDVTITVGTLDRVAALADAMRSMWLDNGVSPGSIIPDYRDEVRRFVERGAREDGLVFFLAEDGDAVVGAACCQRFAGLYPAILTPDVRRYGYLWGVYVAPAYRRAGLGRRLTERCVAALRELGCTHALLHAAPPGVSVYQKLGFTPTNEMRLTL